MNKHEYDYVWRTFMRWGCDWIVRFDGHLGCFVRSGGPLDPLDKETQIR